MTELHPAVIRRLADMHAVYRMFDAAGRLLYVGMTGSAGQRFGGHSMKRWFPLVASITLEWYPTHAAARVAEVRAIKTEHPRYNVAETPRRRSRSLAGGRPAQGTVREPDLDWNVLMDVLKVMGDARSLHWQEIAAHLGTHLPRRWTGVTAEAVSAQCRALGIPSVDVKRAGRVRKGCRRSDLETAIAGRILRSGE